MIYGGRRRNIQSASGYLATILPYRRQQAHRWQSNMFRSFWPCQSDPAGGKRAFCVNKGDIVPTLCDFFRRVVDDFRPHLCFRYHPKTLFVKYMHKWYWRYRPRLANSPPIPQHKYHWALDSPIAWVRCQCQQCKAIWTFDDLSHHENAWEQFYRICQWRSASEHSQKAIGVDAEISQAIVIRWEMSNFQGW